jgi:predicted alpha/beta superfamily hydrolase
MKKIKCFCIAAVTGLLFFNRAFAQDMPVITDSVYSNVLKEERTIQIILPEGYKAGSGTKYDVTYILDGEWDTKKVAWVERYATREKFIPGNIIIGIPNSYPNGENQRQRDFTPTHKDQPANSGGADHFLAFLKTELIPYINQKYPTNPEYNTVWGSSSGGLLGMYALLSQPDLFQSYILSDPALWWDDGYLAKYAQDKWDTLACKNKSLYISGREGGAYQGMGIMDMETMLKKKAPSGLHWQCTAYPNETHSSVILKTVYDGFKWTYSGFSGKEIVFHPMNGIVVKDQPFGLWCRIDVPVVRYTTNGTIPTASSAKMQNFNSIVNPSRLMIEESCTREKYDKIATGNFITTDPLTTVKPPRKLKAGGFHYDYYEGDWAQLPDLKRLKPVRSGIMDKDFDINKLPAKRAFALNIEGFLSIPKDGYYILALDKDDDQGDSKQYTKLSLGGQLIFDYDSLNGNCKEQSFIVPLKKGFYPFHVEYFYKAGVRNLQLVYVQPEHNDSEDIPFESRFAAQ